MTNSGTQPLSDHLVCRLAISATAPLRLGGTDRSLQFGRASAPIITQAVHTLRGPKDGTGT